MHQCPEGEKEGAPGKGLQIPTSPPEATNEPTQLSPETREPVLKDCPQLETSKTSAATEENTSEPGPRKQNVSKMPCGPTTAGDDGR